MSLLRRWQYADVTLSVVLGLGYVGLPLARELTRDGQRVVGVDVSPHVVDGLNGGVSHVDDLADADVAEMLHAGTTFTTSPACIGGADTVIICVPTPLAPEGGPDLNPVRSAFESIAAHLTPQTLVVLESTTWPGTTEEVGRPLLEASGLRAGVDFALAFSPERIDPGNERYGLHNTPKVVGGATAECSRIAAEFYGRIVDQVVIAKGTREAEMAKLLENTYRQVNIALVNEMAMFSHDLGIDIWDVIECASSKPFGFQAFRPGPGVGGHCIPIDPSYLSHRVQARLGYPFRFAELAQEINQSMPQYVARRAQDLLNERGMAMKGAEIAILGVTYKPGIADQRESPAIPLAEKLVELGADLHFYDPFVEVWEVGDAAIKRGELEEVLERADLVIHLQPHDDYDDGVLASVAEKVLDTSGRLIAEVAERL